MMALWPGPRAATPAGGGYVGPMLITNHVLSGAAIGAVARCPAQAFALGAASHFALDSVPHWGRWRDRKQFMRVAVPDGLAGLAIMTTVTASAPAGRRLTMLAAMAGAALPDIDKPFRIFLGFSPFPAAVDRFHRAIQRESQGRAPVEAAAALTFAGALIAARRNGPAAAPDRRS
jgi:hypothetical protein